MSTVVSSTHGDVLLQVAVVLHGFAPTSHISTFNSGVRSPMSEQIYTSVPNHSSSSKDNHRFDEVVAFKSGWKPDLYLEYLAKGLFCQEKEKKNTRLILFFFFLSSDFLHVGKQFTLFYNGITSHTVTYCQSLKTTSQQLLIISQNLPRKWSASFSDQFR